MFDCMSIFTVILGGSNKIKKESRRSVLLLPKPL